MLAFRHILVVTAAVVTASAAGGEADFDYQSSDYRKPPPAIIMHKQALSQDGNFNFVFTSENGLKQGESIGPDGSRQGGYSYVDPNGKTVSVKYIAGKEGFKILEGDVVPKAPELPPQHEYIRRQHEEYRKRSREPEGLEGYRSAAELLPEAPLSRPHYEVHEDPPLPLPRHSPQDHRKAPHKWGPGYSFEFSG